MDIDGAAADIDLQTVEPPVCLPQLVLAEGDDCTPCDGFPEGFCRIAKPNQIADTWPSVDECKPLLEDGCPQISESFDFVTFITIDERDNRQLEAGQGVIDDVLINRLALDYRQNTTTRGLPEIALWVGPRIEEGEVESVPNGEHLDGLGFGGEFQGYSDEEFEELMEKRGFEKLGTIPSQEPMTTGVVEIQLNPIGRNSLQTRLMDRELTLLARGSGVLDTAENPAIPRGSATLQIILRVTFFLSAPDIPTHRY